MKNLDYQVDYPVDYPIVDADVLIIGGGSAGIMAAIRAKEMNAEETKILSANGSKNFPSGVT